MRCGTLGKTEWRKFDDLLKPMIKRTLYLPQPATTLYLYGSRKGGGCGIPIAAEMSDLCRVDNAFKLLTSRDPEVARLAITELQHTVSKRLRRDVNTEDIEAFLNCNTEGDFRGASNPLRSTWTEARKASGRLNITWELSNDAGPAITRAGSTITHNARTKLMAKLRAGLCKERDAELQQLPNQGKVIEAVAADPASSHFMTTGDYMTFAAWRFIHKARLNQLPLNGAQPWNTNADKRCRRCGYASESLPHVLCHCMEKSAAYTERHNKIVERVKSAAQMRYSIISENRPVGDTNLRPDLVLSRGEEAIIVDVTIPFDNRLEAFKAAREEKERKYEAVRQHLLRMFNRVRTEAIIVGALGSWDPQNDRLLKRICTKAYLKTMKKLSVSDIIRASRDIYVSHVTRST
ncbi:uncharacterized protein LOC135372753 [Ornithodoros turicata]|uniref:uncharacterized protein LOC135372753 n=1 Tax=Ornithodoros turicata TaxID=34597 RepID=UPI00313A3475